MKLVENHMKVKMSYQYPSTRQYLDIKSKRQLSMFYSLAYLILAWNSLIYFHVSHCLWLTYTFSYKKYISNYDTNILRLFQNSHLKWFYLPTFIRIVPCLLSHLLPASQLALSYFSELYACEDLFIVAILCFYLVTTTNF